LKIIVIIIIIIIIIIVVVVVVIIISSTAPGGPWPPQANVASDLFFKDIYCTEKSVKYARLQNCSLNQFAIVVTRRVSD